MGNLYIVYLPNESTLLWLTLLSHVDNSYSSLFLRQWEICDLTWKWEIDQKILLQKSCILKLKTFKKTVHFT